MPATAPTTGPNVFDSEAEVLEKLASKEFKGVIHTKLKASDRVIARVTDGIYRQPASAFRELITNAWDADANTVTILTDAPRFARMYVRDDGEGMSWETLHRLLYNIGDSAKRQPEGQTLGMTDKDNPDLSCKGRLLIGKIGIGLFSVSQLAQKFRIVTKVAGNDYRLVVEIRMNAHSEDTEEDDKRSSEESNVAGEVSIVREFANDLEAHGTDIIIDEVKLRVRDLLRSADRWRGVEEKEMFQLKGDKTSAANIKAEPPRFHSGWIGDFNAGQSDTLTREANLPWDANDAADTRMLKLVEAVEREEGNKRSRPELAQTLDIYLESLWTLALSAPVGYVGSHPFDLTSESGVKLYWISNSQRGSGQALNLEPGKRVRDVVREQVSGNPVLQDGAPDPAGGFNVRVDGVDLRRPIQFKFARPDPRGIDHPVLFVGKDNPNLSGVDPRRRGGELAFESYMFWNSKIIPKENNGVLVRIRGASGAPFDTNFFKYQVSEQNRLRQITAEIFVQKGLDAALNIDRESFNFAHPHYQLVQLWTHGAIRQLTNRLKELNKELSALRRANDAGLVRDAIAVRAETVWVNMRGSDPLPTVTITRTNEEAVEAREKGYLVLARSTVPSLNIAKESDRENLDARAAALVQVLSAYTPFEDLTYSQQQELIEAILQVFLDLLHR